MVTNGTVLNKKRRESLLASGITKVFISLAIILVGTIIPQINKSS